MRKETRQIWLATSVHNKVLKSLSSKHDRTSADEKFWPHTAILTLFITASFPLNFSFYKWIAEKTHDNGIHSWHSYLKVNKMCHRAPATLWSMFADLLGRASDIDFTATSCVLLHTIMGSTVALLANHVFNINPIRWVLIKSTTYEWRHYNKT